MYFLKEEIFYMVENWLEVQDNQSKKDYPLSLSELMGIDSEE